MFSKKMADENKIIKDKAAKLLPTVWNYETEFTMEEAGSYIRQAIEKVAKQIQPEFPTVSTERIKRQVNVVLMRKRGEGVRKRLGR